MLTKINVFFVSIDDNSSSHTVVQTSYGKELWTSPSTLNLDRVERNKYKS